MALASIAAPKPQRIDSGSRDWAIWDEAAVLAADVFGEQAAQPLEQRRGMLGDQTVDQRQLTEVIPDGREQDLLTSSSS